MATTPFIPVSNTLRVQLLIQTATADHALSGFWVKRSSAWDLAHINAMMAAFITWFTTGDGAGHTYQGQVSTAASLVEVQARDYTIQNGISVASNAGLPIAGTATGAAAPPGITFALTQRTGLAGRSFRGRTFLVNPASAFFSNPALGTVATASANAAVLAFNALITAVTAADAAASLVVVSRFNKAANPTPPYNRGAGVTTPVTGYGFSNLTQDFQRRRSPAHHRHA